MISSKLIEIESNSKKSNHSFYFNENSNRLAVIFPGGNNSVNRPLLHYIRKEFFNRNYDVLCVSYANLFERKETNDEKMNKIVQGVNSALNRIKDEKQHDEIIFVSRSAGNLAASDLKIKYSIDVKKSIYISPTSDAIKYMNKYPGFIITSSNDEYLEKGDVEKLKKLHANRILVFQDGTHSLETNNIIKTIDFHKLAVTKIFEYIDE